MTFMSAPASLRCPAAGPRCPFASVRARDVPSQQTRVRRGDSIRLRAALEEEAPSLFDNNPQFASVFKQSLARQGQGALSRSSSPRPAREERRPSAAEEILQTALHQSRRNLVHLEELRGRLEDYIVQEERQLDRMEFALQRAMSDAAYIRTLGEMRESERQKSEDPRHHREEPQYGSSSRKFSWEEEEPRSPYGNGAHYEEEPTDEEPDSGYDRWKNIRLR